jgi:hypothetical protein
MQNINNYKSDSIYTFNTAIIGKEDIIVTTNTNKIIIPGFQLGFQLANRDNPNPKHGAPACLSLSDILVPSL